MRDNVVTVTQNGGSTQYALLPDGSYKSPPGSAATLRSATGFNRSFVIDGAHGSEVIFDQSGKVWLWYDSNGNFAQFGYNQANGGRLFSITNGNSNRFVTFEYESAGASARVSAIEQGDRRFEYDYDDAGNLVSVSNPAGETTTYAYGDDGLLEAIYTPNSPTVPSVLNVYNEAGQVLSQMDAMGNEYSYIYSGKRTVEIRPDGSWQAW